MQYNYLERIKKFEKRVNQIVEADLNSIHSLLFSSCLKRFYPKLSVSEYPKFIAEVLFNQFLAWEEQFDNDILSESNIISIEDLTTAPKIYCSFHTSSYRLGMRYLLVNNIPITLVASKAVIQQQSNVIYEVSKSISQYSPHRIIDANNPSSILTMRRELNEGRSLFVYLDGNAGVINDVKDNKNLQEVKVLASTIKARTGIAHLSKMSNVPIVPIFVTRDKNSFPTIELLSSIYPSSEESRSEHVERTIKKLYSELNIRLERNPEQWEAWLYLYKFATKKRGENIPHDTFIKNLDEYRGSHSRFLVWEDRNKLYIMDNTDFSMIDITNAVMKPAI